MARDFVSASSQYLSVATAAITQAPFTFSLAFYPTAAVNGTIMGCYNTGSPANWFDIQFRSTQVVRIRHQDGTVLNVDTVATASLNAWHYAAHVCASNSDRTVYLDGGNAVNNTTAKATPVGINSTQFGRTGNNTPTNYFDGRLGEGGIWDVALGADEIAALADGISPLLVRPGSLVGYWPILGRFSPEIDVVGRLDLTVTGATVADHVFQRGPAGVLVGKPAAAAPPGALVKLIGERQRLVGHAGGLVG